MLNKEQLETPVARLIENARETPEIQALFGWEIMKIAHANGCQAVQDVVNRLELKA